MSIAAENVTAPSPLTDPVAEATRLTDAARSEGVTVRALGGVAIHMRSPGRVLLPRTLKDIDLVTARKQGPAVAQLLARHSYVGEEMFNALRGHRRQLFFDPANSRQLDVFVGEFSMCHEIPIADRLEGDAYTVPLAELLLTKLQIVQLNERDERDIFSLIHEHDVVAEDGGAEAEHIARLCAGDWGLWRTCKGTIERCQADLDEYGLDPSTQELIRDRLTRLWAVIDDHPKSGKWRRRSRLGERKRWYEEPEE